MSELFVPDPSAGRVATFDELKEVAAKTDGQVFFFVAEKSKDRYAPATTYDPKKTYGLSDTDDNILWVSFAENGKVESADRDAGSTVDHLLPYLADEMVSEHDDAFFDLAGDESDDDAVAPDVGGPSMANVPRSSSPAIESAANRLVRQLIGG